MLGKLLAGKALAAVAVIGLTASGAAAATGSLPDPVQGVVSDTVSHVGLNIPHPNHGKSADHRQDGKHDQSGDEGQPGDQSKGMSGTVEDLKGQINDGKLEGPLGQQVCAVASKGNCVHENAGSGDDEGTTSNTGGSSENHGRNSDDPAGQSGDDHGKDEVTPPTTPTTGSIETGEDHSGRGVGSDNSGKGKSGSDN